jgi:hypothetical protein
LIIKVEGIIGGSVFDPGTECFICQKRTSVLNHAVIGGTVVEVCDECLKYGKKIECTDVDKMILHTSLIEVINIERK